MEKSIVISYKTVECDEIAVSLLYDSILGDSVRTIYCRVNMLISAVPAWLRPLKFTVRAIYDGARSEPLINETSGVHTLNAALFMEAAQMQILGVEDHVARKPNGR